jgi:hypothetical protein
MIISGESGRVEKTVLPRQSTTVTARIGIAVLVNNRHPSLICCSKNPEETAA